MNSAIFVRVCLHAAATACGGARGWRRLLSVHCGPAGGHTAEVLALAVVAGGLLASAGADRTIHVWDAAATTHVRAIGAPPPPAPPDAAAAEPATAGDGDADGGCVEPPPPHHTDAVNSLVPLADGAVLASGSTDGTVRLWRVDGAAAPPRPLFPKLSHV